MRLFWIKYLKGTFERTYLQNRFNSLKQILEFENLAKLIFLKVRIFVYEFIIRFKSYKILFFFIISNTLITKKYSDLIINHTKSNFWFIFSKKIKNFTTFKSNSKWKLKFYEHYLEEYNQFGISWTISIIYVQIHTFMQF